MTTNSKSSLFGFSLDDLTQYSTLMLGNASGSIGGIGSIESAITDNFYGINHRQTPTALPHNRDQNGLTFFTRPQLHLDRSNLRNDRRFFPLLTKDPLSLPAILRNTLDPRLHHGWGGREAKDCRFVDPEMVFIPFLTNNLISLAGWRDKTLPSFTSQPGMYQESFSMGDGTTRDYSVYDLTATFRNSIGNPITKLMEYWLDYISNVFEGTMNPYPDFMLMNEIDYNTRIYQLVMDKTKTYVQHIYATGAAYPINAPIGSQGDFSAEKPYNDANAEITIQFRCMGQLYDDEILFHNFNNCVGIFQENMLASKIRSENLIDDKGSLKSSTGMTKIKPVLLPLFNHRGYPYINLQTYELEWYVSTDYLENKLTKLAGMHKALTGQPLRPALLNNTTA